MQKYGLAFFYLALLKLFYILNSEVIFLRLPTFGALRLSNWHYTTPYNTTQHNTITQHHIQHKISPTWYIILIFTSFLCVSHQTIVLLKNFGTLRESAGSALLNHNKYLLNQHCIAYPPSLSAPLLTDVDISQQDNGLVIGTEIIQNKI